MDKHGIGMGEDRETVALEPTEHLETLPIKILTFWGGDGVKPPDREISVVCHLLVGLHITQFSVFMTSNPCLRGVFPNPCSVFIASPRPKIGQERP